MSYNLYYRYAIVVIISYRYGVYVYSLSFFFINVRWYDDFKREGRVNRSSFGCTISGSGGFSRSQAFLWTAIMYNIALKNILLFLNSNSKNIQIVFSPA